MNGIDYADSDDYKFKKYDRGYSVTKLAAANSKVIDAVVDWYDNENIDTLDTLYRAIEALQDLTKKSDDEVRYASEDTPSEPDAVSVLKDSDAPESDIGDAPPTSTASGTSKFRIGDRVIRTVEDYFDPLNDHKVLRIGDIGTVNNISGPHFLGLEEFTHVSDSTPFSVDRFELLEDKADLKPGSKVRCRYNDSSRPARYLSGDIGAVMTVKGDDIEVWLDILESPIGFSIGELEWIERD